MKVKLDMRVALFMYKVHKRTRWYQLSKAEGAEAKLRAEVARVFRPSEVMVGIGCWLRLLVITAASN